MHAIVEEIPGPIGADRRLLARPAIKLPDHLATIARSATAESARPSARPPRRAALRKTTFGLGETAVVETDRTRSSASTGPASAATGQPSNGRAERIMRRSAGADPADNAGRPVVLAALQDQRAAMTLARRPQLVERQPHRPHDAASSLRSGSNPRSPPKAKRR
jgi:hypothetical protein